MEDFNNQNNEHNDREEISKGNTAGALTPKINPLMAALLGLAGAFFLYQIVGGLLTLIVFNFDFKNGSVNAIRLMTMGGQILFILLPALVFSKMFFEDVTSFLRIKYPNYGEIAIFTFGIVILSLLLQNYLYIQNFYIEELSKQFSFVKSAKTFLDSINDMVEKSYGDLLSVHNLFDLFLVITVVSIIPALCEEIMFRGYIQRSFEFRYTPVKSALITAVFFGLYHFNPYGLIPLTALGFFFGYAAYKSGSIFVPMFLHFVNNFTAVTFYIIFGSEDLLNSAATAKIDIKIPVIGFFILLVIFIGYIVMVNRFYLKEQTIKEDE